MTLLVTGGAGYIGSHLLDRLIEANHTVIIVDDLSNSRMESVNADSIFYKIDITDIEKLESVFNRHDIDVVIHLAAKTSAPESMDQPYEYFKVNTFGTMNILELMKKYNVENIIFSSSAAVYGPSDDSIKEDQKLAPLNVYGQSKLDAERIIEWYSKINDFNYVNFRFFNVCGYTLKGKEKFNRLTLIPQVIKSAYKNNNLEVYGDDYDTYDGSCIRDYIHIDDLTLAFILVLKKINNSSLDSGIYNLGSGSGCSVLEVIKETEKVTNKIIKYKIESRRTGDPVVSIASHEKAKKLLNWQPSKSLRDIIIDEWNEIQESKV